MANVDNGTASVGSTFLGQVVLKGIRKLAEHEPESKPESNTSHDFCFDFLLKYLP